MLTTFTNADLFTIVYFVTLAALSKIIIIIYVNHKDTKMLCGLSGWYSQL